MLDQSKISALISLFVAILILIVNFFQWWNITYNGGMKMKDWVKILFLIFIVLLIFAGYLIITSS